MDKPAEICLRTRMGNIIGLQHSGHQDFLGIRYAQAPIGKLRFMPPQCIDSWEDTYDATHFGPMAPQAYADTPPIQLEESEDCLSLNIHTPCADGNARPVMVYIHGGGYLIDSGSRPRTYGGPLAENGGVVVVTIEYRMGAFGFLYADGISPNLGLQDQVCALEWVQRHIADFGGDPNNITIFGESAGATSVAYLLVMPRAKGLFHRAILESGAFPFESQDQNRRFATNGTQKFFNQLKIKPGDLEALQQVPYTRLISSEKKAAGQLLFSDRAFYPVIDGTFVPENIYSQLRNGCSRNIPIIIGINAEELPIFGTFIKSILIQNLVKANILAKLKKLGVTGRQLKQLVEIYRDMLPQERHGPRMEFNQLFSDENFRIPATLFAEADLAAGGKVFFYCFSHPAPKIGAASHVLEVYYVFGTIKTTDIAEIMQIPGTDEECHLSQTMMTAWSSFAKSGDPNHPGLSDWRPYDLKRRATMFFDLKPELKDLPSESARAAWMEIVNSALRL